MNNRAALNNGSFADARTRQNGHALTHPNKIINRNGFSMKLIPIGNLSTVIIIMILRQNQNIGRKVAVVPDSHLTITSDGKSANAGKIPNNGLTIDPCRAKETHPTPNRATPASLQPIHKGLRPPPKTPSDGLSRP